MKIVALVPYRTGFCSGQKFRIELWANHLRARGIDVEFFPFANTSLTDIIYNPGQTIQKGGQFLRCYVDQLRRVASASRPDLVFIYREAALIGPALIETLTQRWKAPIIYDLDEPLFLPYKSPRNGHFSKLKFFSKVYSLFKMSDRVLAVNKVIADRVSQYNSHVSIVPMAVDIDRYRPGNIEGNSVGDAPPRIGWVGTLTNQHNLELVGEPMRRLTQSRGVILRVVADEKIALPGVDVEFINWTFDAEVARLQECQIGIVPVKPSDWGPWKFFFKTIQFMSLGLPVVATPIGSNPEIIEDGVNGFLADSDDEWEDRLRTLIDNPELRRKMGDAARRTAEDRFGLSKQIDLIENIFRSAVDEKRLK